MSVPTIIEQFRASFKRAIINAPSGVRKADVILQAQDYDELMAEIATHKAGCTLLIDLAKDCSCGAWRAE
jgi:hypothetical protein